MFDATGNSIPVTLLSVLPNTVLQVRDQEKDGYEAVQLGYGDRRRKNIRKPEQGHFADLGNFRYVKEFRIPAEEAKNLKRGDMIEVSTFGEGDMVKVSGTSKSKGFQGVVKRHGFHGAPASHGTKHTLRSPGSIGASGPQKVMKGMRMAGRMGGVRISVRGLKVAKVDAENKILAIRGAVPGRKGTLLEIRGD